MFSSNCWRERPKRPLEPEINSSSPINWLQRSDNGYIELRIVFKLTFRGTKETTVFTIIDFMLPTVKQPNDKQVFFPPYCDKMLAVARPHAPVSGGNLPKRSPDMIFFFRTYCLQIDCRPFSRPVFVFRPSDKTRFNLHSIRLRYGGAPV